MTEQCINCEYFDIGGQRIADHVRRTGESISGDCLSHIGAKFEPMSTDSFGCFVLDSTLELHHLNKG